MTTPWEGRLAEPTGAVSPAAMPARFVSRVRTSNDWPGTGAVSEGGGAKAANAPVGSGTPAGCATAVKSRPSAARMASVNCCSLMRRMKTASGSAVTLRHGFSRGLQPTGERRHTRRRIGRLECGHRVLDRPIDRREKLCRRSRLRPPERLEEAGNRRVDAVEEPVLLRGARRRRPRRACRNQVTGQPADCSVRCSGSAGNSGRAGRSCCRSRRASGLYSPLIHAHRPVLVLAHAAHVDLQRPATGRGPPRSARGTSRVGRGLERLDA